MTTENVHTNILQGNNTCVSEEINKYWMSLYKPRKRDMLCYKVFICWLTAGWGHPVFIDQNNLLKCYSLCCGAISCTQHCITVVNSCVGKSQVTVLFLKCHLSIGSFFSFHSLFYICVAIKSGCMTSQFTSEMSTIPSAWWKTTNGFSPDYNPVSKTIFCVKCE